MVFPGISLFYGGLVRRKIIISIYAQCVVIAAAAILSWMTISYSLAFSPTGGAFIGDFSRIMRFGARHQRCIAAALVPPSGGIATSTGNSLATAYIWRSDRPTKYDARQS